MKLYCPLFPLPWVLFPTEEMNLHIFEPRYRQLIREIEEENGLFGLPFFQDGKVRPGSTVRLLAVRKTFPDGRMDITVMGQQPFEVERFDPKAPGKLYPGGFIRSLPCQFSVPQEAIQQFSASLESYFSMLGSRPVMPQEPAISPSFRYGHKLGLSPEQELHLLRLEEEEDRIEFLMGHLQESIHYMESAERARTRIRQNGHFKNFDPLDFS